ncbi:MAG: amino acid permease, partial [Candidatus Omnitrophota bacterium]
MERDNIKKIGLFSAAAIVAGNMMGSGIALLPANLAKIGSISLIAWVIAGIGALALALVYARLGTEDPQPGGPVAYAGEISPILGFQTGVLYFNANWIGNLAIAITGVAYLSVFFPVLTHSVPAGILTIIIIWIFTGLNLLGANWIGRLVSVGVILLLIPVVLTGTYGWAFFDPKLFSANWNTGGQTPPQAVMAAILLCIWSFIGVES